jgi:hypothetical protein
MFDCVPDWRWIQVLEAQKTSIDPPDELAKKVYDVEQGRAEDAVISHALAVFRLPPKRDVLTAFLLSKATLVQAEKGTWIPEEVCQMYERIFLDPDQFQDKIDLYTYAHYYRDEVCLEKNRIQIEKALTDGPYALLEEWSVGNEIIVIPDDEVASKLLGIALAKVSAAAQSSILSEASREGLRWANFAAKTLDTRNKLNPTPADADDLMMDLEKEKVNESIGVDGAGFDLSHLVN